MTHTLAARRRPLIALAGVAVAALTLSACGGPSSGTSAPAAATTGAPAASSSSTTALTVADFWVRAQDTEMTGMFGTITNNSDQALTITGGTSPVGMVELHEVVMQEDGSMVMQQRKSGFEVRAHDTYVLEPGRDDVMLMGLKAPIKVGDQVTVTLTASDGEQLVINATARNFTAEEEKYANGDGHTHTHGPSMTGTMSPSGSGSMGGMTP